MFLPHFTHNILFQVRLLVQGIETPTLVAIYHGKPRSCTLAHPLSIDRLLHFPTPQMLRIADDSHQASF